MSFESTLRLREDLPSHALFHSVRTQDFQKISSPVELGYHPDTVLSVLDSFPIFPKQMPTSAVYGEDFAAVRCAPVDQYDASHAKVWCIYLRRIGEAWTMMSLGKIVTNEEFDQYTRLANREIVPMNGQHWRRI